MQMGFLGTLIYRLVSNQDNGTEDLIAALNLIDKVEFELSVIRYLSSVFLLPIWIDTNPVASRHLGHKSQA